MNKPVPIVLGFILLIVALWLQVTNIESVQHFIERLESIAYDVQLRAQLFTQPKLKQAIVNIVDIDDRSLAKEGRWPWPREKVSLLIKRLQEEKAVVIAFDVIFPEREINIADTVLSELNKDKLSNSLVSQTISKIKPNFDGDTKLANTFKNSDIILGISFLTRDTKEGYLPPPLLNLQAPQNNLIDLIDMPGVIGNIEVLQNAAKSSGFINVFPDGDGIIRRVPILLSYKDNLYPSLALETVRVYLLSNVSLVTASYREKMRLEGVRLGDYVIPTDEQAEVIVPYRGKSYTFPYFSATDVLNKKIPANALNGKIVFIGTSATGLGDLKTTPIQNVFPGVEIQASIAQGILDQNFSYQPSWELGAKIFLTVLLGLICIFLFPILGPRTLGLLVLLFPFLLIFANMYLWKKTGAIISIFIPVFLIMALAILNMVYGYLFETRRRERLKLMFGQYVPEKHIDEMLKVSSNYGLYGEDREMTVLFADIRNFTTISENLSATQLKDFLNQFFTPMTEIIFKYRGTIDKYVGDLIMAFWGAPLRDKKHAERSIRAALDMQKTINTLKPVFKQQGLPEINMGIGINTGVMSVGDMGSRFRRNYTVLGDAVNLASRIEGLTKFYGVSIIVSEHTYNHQKDFLFRLLDRVRVKGKNASIAIYEPLALKLTADMGLKNELASYQDALNLYFAQNWEMAHQRFEKLVADYPHCKLYSLYLMRSGEFLKNPPQGEWDGVFVHGAK